MSSAYDLLKQARDLLAKVANNELEDSDHREIADLLESVEQLPPEPDSFKSFLFEVGDSASGPISYCARVRAFSDNDALSLLRAAIAEQLDITPYIDPDLLACQGETGIEYLSIYINKSYLDLGCLQTNETEEVEETEER
jgi:hypothetical protein